MKAVVYRRYGQPDRMHLRDVPKPEPKADEVLVKVHATSVNSWDWDQLTGKPLVRFEGPFRPKHRILGADIAGIVEAVGANVTRFHPGEAVFGDLSTCGWGGFAEYATAKADLLAPMPEGLSSVDAAAIPQAGSLALQSIRKRDIKRGDQVLINGAGGGVGAFAVQLAKMHGAEVTAVDHPEKFDFMLRVGADHVIDYTREDYTSTGDSYDLIVDMVATRSMRAYAGALNPGGAMVIVGGSMGAILRSTTAGAVARGKTIGLLMWKPSAADNEELAALVVAGKIRVPVDTVFTLANTPDALSQIGDGNVKGKLVVSMMAGAG